MNIKLKVAFLMDPLEKLDLKGDTSFALALEAQKRGHKIHHFTPDALMLRSNKVLANICKFELVIENDFNNFKYYEKNIQLLSDFDIVLMRQDPPFDMSYITAT
ncbi:MAG: glutathione synthase, partial [Alphaproteobacteria bacterium]|nr:glutathione synthase [Alphaproteobacteria bacterium]